jgi:hypothetical protein
MENPYSAPRSEAPAEDAFVRSSRWVRHVGFLAAAQMVVGALEALLGIAGTAMGVLIAVAVGRGVPGAAGVPPATLWMGAGFYLAIGLAGLATGGLRIFAGIRNLKYRGRVLGIVALSLGLLTAVTVFCAPTSIALLIYGLIVYLDSDVAKAFDMGNQGLPPHEIRARLSA